nr:minor capsid protein [Streptomonospora sp. PA3]
MGVGTYHADGTPGGTIYLTTLPDTPDVALSVARYGAGAEGDIRNGWHEPRMQLRARGTATDARTGEQLAQAAYGAMHGLAGRTLAGGTWLALAVGLQSGPVYMGRDQSGRHEHVVNLRIAIER